MIRSLVLGLVAALGVATASLAQDADNILVIDVGGSVTGTVETAFETFRYVVTVGPAGRRHRRERHPQAGPAGTRARPRQGRQGKGRKGKGR